MSQSCDQSHPGDVLTIPDVEPVVRQVKTGKTYTFVVTRPRTVLRLALEVNEAPRPGLVAWMDATSQGASAIVWTRTQG